MNALNPLNLFRHLLSKYPNASKRRKPARKYKIVWLGMISAGKTSLIERITKNTFQKQQFHTLGVHVEELKNKHEHYVMWEVGGAESFIRTLWDVYTRDSDAIIFVIDSTAPELFPTLKELIINHITSQPHLKHVPVLLLANKQDLPKAIPSHLVAEQLELHTIVDDRPWAFFDTSAVTSQNLSSALNWLCRTIKATSVARDDRFLDCCIDKNTVFQYLSRFTPNAILNFDVESFLRPFTTINGECIEPMEQLTLLHFMLPHAHLYLQKFLHQEIRKHVQGTLTKRIKRLHPSLSLHVINSSSFAMIEDEFLESRNPNLVEEVLSTIDRLKQDWVSQELIITQLLAESHVNRVSDRIMLHLRSLLEMTQKWHLGTQEISFSELEFKLKTIIMPPLIDLQLRNISKLQELVASYWTSYLDSLKQKILEFNDKNTLANLLEFNLPDHWILDRTTRLHQWIVYREDGDDLPAPPFYLKILLENPSEPRVQAVLACRECQQHVVPTSFIPCIVLPPNKRIELIDQRAIPVSENYLLVFGKIILLVIYAEALIMKNRHDPSSMHRKKVSRPPVEISIKTQFLEKFGLVCSHYDWI